MSRLTVRPVTPEHWLRGIAAALLEGALTHARKRRASSLEAYPHLLKKDDYMGQLDLFREHGFRVVRKTAKRAVVRKEL